MNRGYRVVMKIEKDIAKEAELDTLISRSPYYLAFRKFLRHPLAKWGGIILIVLYTLIIFAEFIAPYDFDNESRGNSYNPPSKIRFIDAQGKFHISPFVYNTEYGFDQYYRRVFKERTEKR